MPQLLQFMLARGRGILEHAANFREHELILHSRSIWRTGRDTYSQQAATASVQQRVVLFLLGLILCAGAFCATLQGFAQASMHIECIPLWKRCLGPVRSSVSPFSTVWRSEKQSSW